MRHAFRVAASLDSMVIGEPQILGQVKEAYEIAEAAKSLGPSLGALRNRCLSAAKRARSETRIGVNAVSVSSVAVELARKIFGTLKDRVVLLNVVFTHCKDACPLITRKLRDVRDALGEERASQITFVTLTSDPQNDTPEVLKAFTRQQGVESPNWLFLTGDKANVDLVLARLARLQAVLSLFQALGGGWLPRGVGAVPVLQ